MGLFSFLINFFKRFLINRLPTSDLTYLYVRLRYYLPELDEETASLLTARLYLQQHLKTGSVDLVDLVIAYNLGASGFCGLTLTDMKRHDHQLLQDQTSKLTRWIMQIEFIVLSTDLMQASPAQIADVLIQSKPRIISDIDQVLAGKLRTKTKRDEYDQLIQHFTHSPDYSSALEQISYAIQQVQSDQDE